MPESSTLEQILEKYGNDREALVEILRDVSQAAGYVTPEALATIAQRLNLPQSQVHSVAGFYSLISLKPMGKHVIRFCQDAPCHVVGGQEIWETLEQTLGIPFGATTSDKQWTLLATSCIGACSVGPVMMVDDEIYGNLTPDRVREVLAQVGGDV
mgnify:FL=1